MANKYFVIILGAVVLLNTQAYADPTYRENYRWYMSEFNDSEGFFTEVAGLELETSAIEYRNGDEETHARKLNGLNKYGNITLKWGRSAEIGKHPRQPAAK